MTTWQNPSFTGTLSHAVLREAPAGLVKDVVTTPGRPVPGLEPPSLTLPVANDEPPLPVNASATAELPIQRAPHPIRATR
ncbi:hypothetical protein, partial [Streptomyces ipomoeae]